MEPIRHVDPVQPVQLVAIQPEVEVEETLECPCCHDRATRSYFSMPGTRMRKGRMS
jgi:hypothetical protein